MLCLVEFFFFLFYVLFYPVFFSILFIMYFTVYFYICLIYIYLMYFCTVLFIVSCTLCPRSSRFVSTNAELTFNTRLFFTQERQLQASIIGVCCSYEECGGREGDQTDAPQQQNVPGI